MVIVSSPSPRAASQAMASSPLVLAQAFFFLLLATSTAQYAPMTLTIFNNCPFTIWPAIQPNAGSEVLEGGGFELPSLAYRSFSAPAHPWSGRFWARTGCRGGPRGRLSCYTGDCGGRLRCGGLGGAVPASLAQLTLHDAGSRDKVSYGVSLVDGFNLPLTVTPHEGKGTCPVEGCRADLLPACPGPLKVWSSGGYVVGCNSGCAAFRTDELCCRNEFSRPAACRPSGWSEYFKRACPDTFTYPQDTPSLATDCAAPRELKLIFCQ